MHAIFAANSLRNPLQQLNFFGKSRDFLRRFVFAQQFLLQIGVFEDFLGFELAFGESFDGKAIDLKEIAGNLGKIKEIQGNYCENT